MKQKEKTEITREKIFMAAIREFGTNGYALGSINNICKTGINKGLVYHNFKDKDELYLECVKRSLNDLIGYVAENKADESFVKYMDARKKFFDANEYEAYIFLEARTNPPGHLVARINEIYSDFNEFNIEICSKELSGHKLRDKISEEEALSYFSAIQRWYNYEFLNVLGGKMTVREKLNLHEMNVCKLFDIMLYGIAKEELK
ncbi:MAG: TetR/AcrR family transcriptional regulator [Butyrivibrio sp.]